jgi:starvation-inducible DNA-binding protein
MNEEGFGDYHLLFDEHAEQLFVMTGDVAERERKIGGTTLRSISNISEHQSFKCGNEESVTPDNDE